MTPTTPTSAKSRWSSVALLLTLALPACESNLNEDYQQRLRKTQPHPAAVTFDKAENYPGDVLCGVYSTLTSDGVRLITGDFVVTPDLVIPKPTELQTLLFCSRRSEDLLFSRLGIGGDSATWRMLAAVDRDMQAIDDAITRYFNEQQIMPNSLEQLVTQGFLGGAGLATDPWGNVYVYEEELTGRTTPKYSLTSYGRDGAPAGTGPDADITDDYLPYVHHVLRVKGLLEP